MPPRPTPRGGNVEPERTIFCPSDSWGPSSGKVQAFVSGDMASAIPNFAKSIIAESINSGLAAKLVQALVSLGAHAEAKHVFRGVL